MKTFKRITWGLLIFLAVVYILPAAVLQVPYVQKNISNKTTEYLETKLGTKVHIQSIKLELFNRLILKNVLMEDQAGDTLFIAKRIGAGFEFLPLFKSKFYFNSAQLYSFTLNLNRETTDSPLNLQYIMDAFRKKDTIENSAIDVKIKDMDLRLGNFTYRIKDKASTANLFNPNDLHFQKISTRIKVRKWTDKELDIRLNKLSLTEKTGLQVKHLSFDLFADTLKAEIKKLRLELPSSKLQIADIYLNYGEKKSVTEMPFHLFIELSDISLKDLSSIVPTFSLYNDKVTVQGDFSGTINDFTCNRVSIHCDDELLIQAHARIQNATEPYPNAIYMNGHVEKSNVNASVIQRIIYNLGEKGFVLPEQIQNLGNISFNGELAGNMDNLNAHGYFSTEPGNLIVDITLGKKQDLFIKGQISSSDFDLKQLMKDDNFGTTTFNIDVNTSLNKSNRASGYLDAHISSLEYKRYDYENIHLNGEFAHSCFNGSLNIENPNGKLAAQGSFRLNGKHSEFNLSASASNIRLDKLNLTKKFQNPLLSFAIDARFTGNEIDNLLGKLHLHDLSFSTNKDNFILDNFEIQTNRQDTIKEIHVVSDFINGNIKGIYSIKSLIPELKQTLAIYLPSLFREKKNSYEKKENDFSLDFTFHNSKDLTSILEFPIVFYNPSRITGYYNNSKNELKVNADIPLFKVAGTVFEEGELNLRNKEDYVRLELKGSLLQKEKKIGVNVSFTAENDFIHSSVFWKNTGRQRHEGKLEFTTCFNGEREGPPAARIDIKRSQLIFNDSIWTLYPTTINARPGKIEIDDFRVQNRNQIIKIAGNIAHNADEQIRIDLNQVDLSYIFKTLNIKALDFGGIATGKVIAKDVYNTCQLTTDLDVADFAFNQVIFGHLLLNGSWDDKEQGVKMVGNVSKNDTTNVRIDGMIYPLKEELSILFDAQNADAAFLRKYLNKVVQNFSGQITGPIRLFGDLNHPTLEGTFDVKNGGFGIQYLNTYYTFSDKVVCTPDKISIQNLTLYDENKNRAVATGYVMHKQLNDFTFSVNLDFEHFFVFNANKMSNPAFYGTAYGTGRASLKGTEELVNINISMQNTENSKMILNFMDGNDVAEYNFIHFLSKEKKELPASPTQYLPIVSEKPLFLDTNHKTEIRLTLSLGITPSATIELLTNSLTGDKINAYGSGHLDIQYGTSTPLKVMGNYTIEKGKYNFSLQQVIIRNFDIKEGSLITFSGNPYAAELDLNAAYTVSANLGDLDERLYLLSARNNVPIDCILLLNGPLSHPNISFDLDMPKSTPELTRQVKSYIRTDDMMNRQILYLLVLGRFYTSPEYVRSDSRLNNDLSFLTSTLSSQLSNILGSLSNNFQIETAFHQAYEGEKSSTEIELLLSSTLLNNRLTINGNFGYINNSESNTGQNNPIHNNNTPVVGDLDIEYKLTPAGNIRLKVFNHYNYRNYYSITPELTQGIGILFRKEFDHFYNLLGKKRKTPDGVLP